MVVDAEQEIVTVNGVIVGEPSAVGGKYTVRTTDGDDVLSKRVQPMSSAVPQSPKPQPYVPPITRCADVPTPQHVQDHLVSSRIF